jgi:hypothetical protein
MMGLYKLGMKPTHASLQDTNKVLQTVLTCQIERSRLAEEVELNQTDMISVPRLVAYA